MDARIGSWGLTSLHERWKSAEHQLQEIKYRLKHDKPLANKSFKEASKKDCDQEKPLIVGMVPLHIDSTFALIVTQVPFAENELEEGSEAHLLNQLQADKLKMCLFVDSLKGHCDFPGVIRSVEMLASNLLLERRMQALALTIAARHVSNFCVFNDLMKTLQEYIEWLHVCAEIWVSFCVVDLKK